MKVIEFNINKAGYHFELGHFKTTMYAHPAIEMTVALDSAFSVCTKNSETNDLQFAILDKNVHHRIDAKNCKMQLVMFELDLPLPQVFLSAGEIDIQGGMYFEKDLPYRLELSP